MNRKYTSCPYRLLYNYCLIALLLLMPQGSFAQRNVFHFTSPPKIYQGSFPLNAVYEIPTDSVRKIVFENGLVDPNVSWMQHPAYIIPTGKIDSLKALPLFKPGYYLLVGLSQNYISRTFIHKSALHISIEDIERVKVFSVTDDEGNRQNDLSVLLQNKPVPYDEGMKGYIVRDFSDGDTVTIRRGKELDFFRCSVTANEAYKRPKRRNETEEDHELNRLYNGYLVTNKPKYLPHDTVKWKAYIQNPRFKNKPVREDLRVSFNEPYGKTYVISQRYGNAEPGVYFGEFVLGDSITIDRDYELLLSGTRTGYRINQTFKVEDYLLDETKLRVTGEDRKFYQPGDSVNLYAYAYTSNNLPVLDGQINITVMPNGNRTDVNALLFIPDTLYTSTVPVSADGETNIGFSTKGFANQLTSFTCHVTLNNSNYEQKDTTFYISYSDQNRYLELTQTGNIIHAALIAGKQSVAGKGTMYLSRVNAAFRPVNITYPFDYTIGPNDSYVTFNITDDTGRVLSTQTHTIVDADVSAAEDFNGDTASLMIYNSSKVLFRYSLFSGNDFLGYGYTNGDTLLKCYSPKGKTVTMIGAYTWRGTSHSKRFEVFKMDRDMNIQLTKKDLIYPGQKDTISVHLRTKDGRDIGKTNVTVFAFNSQFTEDNTPELPYGGLLYPAYIARRFHQITPWSIPYPKSQLADSVWLARVAADTSFFYKNLYLLPDDIAWVETDIPGSVLPQLGIYLQRSRSYYQPEIIYVDDRPAYIKRINSTNPNGIFIAEGMHNLRVRLAGVEYGISNLQICAGMKTDLYLNVDSIGPFMWQDTVGDSIITYRRANHLSGFTSRQPRPDSLTGYELDAVANWTFLYKTEPVQRPSKRLWQSNDPPQLFQYPIHLKGEKAAKDQLSRGYYDRDYDYPKIYLLGPVNFADSAGFFQQYNTKLRFETERGYLFTFRPQMTRVEKQPVYEYLKFKLQDQTFWPPDSFVTRNPPLFDTMQVQHVANERIALYTKQGIPSSERIGYSLIVSDYQRMNNRANTGRISVISKDSAIVGLILHQEKDTAGAYVQNHPGMLHVLPGRYDVTIIWRNKNYSTYAAVTIAANGTTLLPVSYQTVRGAFSYKLPASWLKRSVKADTLNENNYAFYSVGTAQVKSAGISGTIMDEHNLPAKGVLVQASMNGVVKDTAVTDKQGSFSLKGLPAGTYQLICSIANVRQTIYNIPVVKDRHTKLTSHLPYVTAIYKNGAVSSQSDQFMPFRRNSYSSYSRTAEDIERMPTTNLADLASLSSASYQRRNGSAISLSGARASNTTYIVDGAVISAGSGSFGADGRARKESPDPELGGGKPYLQSPKVQQFINAFVNNMMRAAGMRKSFRDWAIWEPNLWTGKDGNASFEVTYPDNMTSWKTYVLAMNKDRYTGKIMQLTRAFKPLSAQLAAPRFLRYGDTVEVIGKVANYTKQAFKLRGIFRQDSAVTTNDTMTVHNTKVSIRQIAAPSANVIDTTNLQLGYSISTENGFTDGEEKTIPVYPVGVKESKGIFALLNSDTTITSQPDSAAGYFTGNARVFIDGSLLEAMLRDIEQLKVDPHGCNEQLTTKLLSIYYEERIKRLLGNEQFNNTKAKRKILEQLVQAQRADGSYGWWSDNNTDYRITNYIISTMQKINSDGWLDFIIRRGLGHLSSNLESMSTENQIASMATLSEGHYAANYKPVLEKLGIKNQSIYNRLAMVKIRREQGLPYRNELDTLMSMKKETMHGCYWGYTGGYDWYRDDLATTLLAYRIVKGDSIYDALTPQILRYLLFKRQYGYYSNTASNGLVLTTILPDLLQQKPVSRSKSTYVKMTGTLKDSITSFPKVYATKGKKPLLTFEKKGISPVYVSVVYDYLNIQPVAKEDDFDVRTYFLNAANDTVTSLKAGEKVTLRTTVRCKKEADYVMIEVPIPAGCVQAKQAARYGYRYAEAARENFKDQTDIFCNNLQPQQTYTFDVLLEARYKGRFNISPARAGMMYYPEEYGNTGIKKVHIR